MKRLHGITLTLLFTASATDFARADVKDPKTIIDKAMKALGGAEKLKKGAINSSKISGKVIVAGQEFPFTSTTIHDGPSTARSEFQGEINGTDLKVVSVMKGDNGWIKVNDNVTEMEDDRLANQKRNLSIQTLPFLLYPLQTDEYKLTSVPEEKVKGAPALGIKVTSTDGKHFTIFFDKESGLPVKTVADVVDWTGQEFSQEMHFADFKDFSGFKKASKITTMRNGEPFIEGEIVEFKPLDKLPPNTFAEPK